MPIQKNWFLAGGLAAFTMLSMPSAEAHGSPEFPVGRQYNCYLNRSLAACQAAIAYGGEQAVYDWNAVNQAFSGGNPKSVVPDGKLCAGGNDQFKGFDLVRSDWPATAWSPGVNGMYEFRYYATAPHKTLNRQFYLTRNGWQPGARALQWADLDLVATVLPAQITTTPTNRYVMQLNLPARSGKHLLYAVWQRVDSTEAFFSCSDVSFGGTTTPPVTPSPLTQLGQIAATQDLAAGATVKLRVFGSDGSDLETQSLAITSANGAKATWLTQLAALANAKSAYVRVGTLQGGTLTVPAGSTVLQVYALTAQSGVNYALDTVLPSTPPTTPPAADSWTEGATYKTGDIVTYKGLRYICLQGHTAYVGAGWTPDAPSVINVLWQKL